MRWLWAARLPVIHDRNGERLELDAVHDGDTVRLELDLGFNQRGIYPLRLKDVFAPELRQPGGVECRKFVHEWVTRYSFDFGFEDWPFVVETFRTRTGRDLTTLERYVAIVSLRDSKVYSLNVEIQLWLKNHPEWGGGIGS